LLGAVLGLYVFALSSHETEARAIAFLALVLANLALAFAEAAEPGTSFFDRRRTAFWIIGTGAALLLAPVLLLQPPADSAWLFA
jgi:Ca2+-transporting ATPase